MVHTYTYETKYSKNNTECSKSILLNQLLIFLNGSHPSTPKYSEIAWQFAFLIFLKWHGEFGIILYEILWMWLHTGHPVCFAQLISCVEGIIIPH